MTKADYPLRTLDVADRQLTPAQRERAAQLLQRVLATPRRPSPAPAGDAPAEARSPRRHIVGRRIALVGAAITVVTVLSLVVPGLGRSDMAWASWTAVPSAVAQRDLDAAVDACRSRLRWYALDRSRPGGSFDAATMPMALADRRGDIVAVVFHQDGPPEISFHCLATIPEGSGRVTSTEHGLSGQSGAVFVPPHGQIAEGAMTSYGDQAWALDGAAGPGVAAVRIHLGSRVITATVANNRYAAWGPGQAFTDLGAPNGQGGPTPLFTYDVVLTDGTVLQDVAWARPGATGSSSAGAGPAATR